MTETGTQPVLLGRIVGLFGVKGWVRVYSYTEPRDAVLNYARWLLRQNDDWQPAQLAEGRRHGKSIVARLDGIEDRDDAEALVGRDIGVLRDELPEPDHGRYYWADLEGLAVVNSEGVNLGKVERLMATGANDVIVAGGERQRLIPFVMDKVVLDVDFARGVITVDWAADWDED